MFNRSSMLVTHAFLQPELFSTDSSMKFWLSSVLYFGFLWLFELFLVESLVYCNTLYHNQKQEDSFAYFKSDKYTPCNESFVKLRCTLYCVKSCTIQKRKKKSRDWLFPNFLTLQLRIFRYYRSCCEEQFLNIIHLFIE